MPISKTPWKKLLHNIQVSGRRAKAMTNKRKGIDLEINITEKELEEIYNQQNGKCFWFNIPIEINAILEKGNLLSMSADRIDNDKGYVKENIVICCRLANLGRQNCDFDKFKNIIKYIREYKDEQVSNNI